MKKNYLSWIIILCIIPQFFLSCSQESESLPLLDEKPRTIFKSSADFFKTYNNLLNMSSEEQGLWIKSNNFQPVDNQWVNDETFNSTPKAFKAIFNTDLEFQIQDSIIWYNQGKLYVISTNGISANIKKQNQNFPLYAESTIEPINEMSIQTRLEHGYNYRGNHILQYFYYDGTPNVQFRYIAELYAHTVRNNSTSNKVMTYGLSVLYLSLRIDKKGSKWTAGYEPRDVYFNLECRNHLTSGDHKFWVVDAEVVQNSKNNVSGGYEYPLNKRTEWPSHYDRWFIDIRGSIYQQMSGYPSSRLYVPTKPGPPANVIWGSIN
ncbi:hypothetical protein [Bacteroides bouchesdurhonensis]|uniref:hypothetical protein n=1 Tax=Bacteroides bouchesdurhonensis TaxID=1841855 RepID=UPI0011DE3DBF|nr:hypothetical protein [Bacteroides bouchesdurhonensis]